MRAAVLLGPGEIVIKDVEEPSCPEGGMLIRVKACSVCASDVKMLRTGHRDLRYPRILGHELSGELVESRASSANLDIGQRVQVWPGSACGECEPCLKGHDNQCSEERILGFNTDGGFAEYVAVPKGCVRQGGVVQIPDSLSFEVASLAEPLACCVNAQDALGVGKRDRVLIFGGGPLGVLHALLARANGAKSVTIVEKTKARSELLVRHGVGEVCCSEGQREVDAVKGLFSESSADVVLLATPAIQLDKALLSLVAARGRISLFSGKLKDSSITPIDLNDLHYRELSLVGSYGCTSPGNRKAVSLLAEGKVDPRWLITLRSSLDDIGAAFIHAERQEGMKATILQ